VTTVQIELPEELARKAREAGLLTPETLERLIADALRRKAMDELLSVADRMEAAGVPSLTMEEIEAEIQAYRQERRRAGG